MQCVILAGGLGTRMWPVAADGPQDAAAGRRPAVRRLAAGLAGRRRCDLGRLLHRLPRRAGPRPRRRRRRAGASRSTTSTRGPSCAARPVPSGSPLDAGRAGRAVPRPLRRLLAAGRPGRGLRRGPARSGLPALMTVFENDGRFDASNVVYADGARPALREGARPDAAGDALDRLRPVRPRPRPDRRPGARGHRRRPRPALPRPSPTEGALAGFPVAERFYEIGSPAGPGRGCRAARAARRVTASRRPVPCRSSSGWSPRPSPPTSSSSWPGAPWARWASPPCPASTSC